MDIFNGLSDDELALIGSMAALLTTGMIMWLSYFAGRAARRQQAEQYAALQFNETIETVQRKHAGQKADKAA
jgi:hypothetical protein